jgi:SET domain-containing protein
MIKRKKYYKPLPECLSIKSSKIEGLGLFAIKDIAGGTDLGLTHIYDEEFEDNFIRTPLGGFINYKIEPNCTVVATDSESKNLNLITMKDIKNGEEITLKYNLYDPLS